MGDRVNEKVETSADSYLWLGLIIFPLILFFVAGGIWWLSHTYRSKAQVEINLIRIELREAETSLKQLDSQLLRYSTDDPEPYGSKARELRIQLNIAEEGLHGLREQYTSIRERLSNRRVGLLQTIFGIPKVLYYLHKEMSALRSELGRQKEVLSAAEEIGRAMERFPWDIAQQARQSLEKQLQIRQLMEGMRDYNLQGATIEAARLQGKQFDSALRQVPKVFYEDDMVSVFAQVDKTATIDAYEVLRRTRDGQETLLLQLGSWQKQYESAQDKVHQMQQRLINLEGALEAAPTGLDLVQIRQRFEGMRMIGQNLQPGLGRAEIESLPAIAEEGDRVYQAAQELDEELREIRSKAGALEGVLVELAFGLKRLSEQVTILGTSKVHPVAWKQSSNTLSRLSQGVRTLGAIEKQRTPGDLDHDMAEATRLNGEVLVLRSYCEQIAGQHAELLSLLNGAELNQAGLWLQNALNQVKRVGEYDPENWPRADGVPALPMELQSFGDGLQRLVAGNPSQPIGENQVGQRLEETRRLEQDSQALRGRMNLVEGWLAALQASENQAREQLEEARKNLAQTIYLARSNPLLSGAVQDIDRMQRQLDGLGSELDQRQHGTVDNKVRRINGLAARIEQSLNNWLEQLDQDAQASVKALTASLTRLDSIALLEDAAVSNARRLLASKPLTIGALAIRPGFKGSHEISMKMDERVIELKRRSEYGQACAAGLRALEELEKPVVESYNFASQHRQQLQGQYSEISAWLRQTRSWPPSSVKIDSEEKDLARLETEWGAVKGKPERGIELVKRLGELSNAFQRLAERIRRLAEQAGTEQDQAEALVGEIDQYIQLWEKQFHSQGNNPLAKEEIRELLNHIQYEVYRIKLQYRERSFDYSQVMQGLQALHRKARLYQVALDETHVIDMNGRVIASRESTRTTEEW